MGDVHFNSEDFVFYEKLRNNYLSELKVTSLIGTIFLVTRGSQLHFDAALSVNLSMKYIRAFLSFLI